jgi:perosamine synthetase
MPTIGEEEIAEVVEALRSGWLTMGPRTRRFEEEFARYIGCKHAVAVNSCTAALHLALYALGLESGDRVITTPLTFAATAEVIHYFGAQPVFVDVDPETLNIDPEGIRERVDSRKPGEEIRAIIAVHFGGRPCEMGPILEIARDHGIKVIDDAAHALPARYDDRMIGTLSDATAFSFYANKNITTGEGGMAVTNNDEYAESMRIMRLHGISKDAWKRYSARGNWYYEIHQPGFKYNLTDIASAIGIHQLRKCPKFHQRREKIARLFHEGLANIEEITLPPWDFDSPRSSRTGATQHSWHLYVIRLQLDRLTITRGEFIDALKERKIGTSVHFIPLHMQPFYRERYGYQDEDFPNARAAYEEVVSLPIYPGMTNDDVEYVVSTIKETIQSYKRPVSMGTYRSEEAELSA